MNEPITTKVTHINDKWHCRLFYKAKVYDEMACYDRRDIGYCMRYMLRFADKMGINSPMAHASRHRGKNHEVHGKIIYSSSIKNKELTGKK